LARAIEQHAARAGDYFTAIPALSLHRRDAPTEPVHCVYGLGWARSPRKAASRSCWAYANLAGEMESHAKDQRP
jgi:hypothetical protein